MFDPSSSSSHQAPLLFPETAVPTNLTVADYATMIQRRDYSNYGDAGGVFGGQNLLTKKGGGGGGGGKKDRHSKIYTSQGLRDRRVRLSSEIARKFFDLQDMLEYDKASNTLQWLFTKSENAIRDLARTKQEHSSIPDQNYWLTFFSPSPKNAKSSNNKDSSRDKRPTTTTSKKDNTRFPPPHHQQEQLHDPILLRNNFMNLEIPHHQEASFNNQSSLCSHHSPPKWKIY
ncbi:hypothetical protein PIB30_043346 [Stylosanthes scabra]|uniref:TCP domain-containing protein n=1 Tax=Stylosanthes scabra TaxID=79078 RepID=A0ABU6VEI0_9FABA|nr:hypothetical protein [Stylosanthes scabra]